MVAGIAGSPMCFEGCPMLKKDVPVAWRVSLTVVVEKIVRERPC